MAVGLSTSARNASNDAIIATIGASGKVRVYSGTRPATGGTATTLLAELALSATAAPASSSGVVTFNAISNDTSADASGTPVWARILTSGNTPVLDCSAAVGSGDINFNAAIVAGGVVSITSMTMTDGNP